MPRVAISSGPSSEKDIGNDIALPLLSPATVVTLPPWLLPTKGNPIGRYGVASKITF